MNVLLISLSVVATSLYVTNGEVQSSNIDILAKKVLNLKQEECEPRICEVEEGQTMTCGFHRESTTYKMFPSKCALKAYSECYGIYKETPIEFCVKEHNKKINSRRMYGESCPVFCPSHWRPVCGASKMRDYVYRTFNNGCYLDMLNCRGEDEDLGYVEVPLENCQNHAMKNMFKEQILLKSVVDYKDYE